VPWGDGFVFTGPFDEVLSRISEDYLAEVWAVLDTCLRSHGLDATGATWGGGHPTYTGSLRTVDCDSPLGYYGWILPSAPRAGDSALWQRQPYGLSPLGEDIEADLQRRGLPVTIAGARIRGYAARRVVDGVDLAPILPDDAVTGLEAFVEHCVDNPVDWTLTDYTRWLDGDHACARLFGAIATRDAEGYFAALEEARLTYTPAGYRIVVQGFAANLLAWPPDEVLGLVPRAPIQPTVADLGDGLSLEIVEDAYRRPEWAATRTRVDGVEGRYERVHRGRLSVFRRGLGAIASGGEEAATLTYLARSAEIVVRPGTIGGRFTAHEDEATVEYSRHLTDDALAGLQDALDRFATASPRPPHATPLPAWGFRGAPKNVEQLAQMMTILIEDQEP
jgi:hypothetical protein